MHKSMTEAGSEGFSQSKERLCLIHKFRYYAQFYVIYACCFAVICAVLFYPCYSTGRTLIDMKGDPWSQHLKALTYYAAYLRDGLSNLLDGHFPIFREWDYALGEGNDILETLHYYVIGDPFAIGSVMCSPSEVPFYYQAMILMRMFLAGISASLFGFFKGAYHRKALLSAILIYVFGFWTLFSVFQQPFFLNPMIWLPLLLIGIDKILNGERPYVFVLAVAVSAASNLYFFYMLAIITGFYGICRIIDEYETYRHRFYYLMKLLLLALVGIMMAGAVVCPMTVKVLQDARLGTGPDVSLFYPLSYYLRLPALLVSGGRCYELMLGFTAPIAVATFFFLRYKRRTAVFRFGLRILIAIIIPPIGFVLTGFSYANNRWSFAVSLLFASIWYLAYPFMLQVGQTDVRSIRKSCLFYEMYLVFVLLIYLCMDYPGTWNLFASLVLINIFLLILDPRLLPAQRLSRENREWLILGVVMLGICLNGVLSAYDEGFTDSLAAEQSVNEDMHASEASELREIANCKAETDTELVPIRISGTKMTKNANMLEGISSTQYYWSLSNRYASDYRRALGIGDNGPFDYQGYDGFTIPCAIASVDYYATGNDKPEVVPYGYKPLNQPMDSYRYYETDDALPLGTWFSGAIPETDWNLLSAVDRQDALLQGVVLSDSEEELQSTDIILNNVEFPQTFSTCGSGIDVKTIRNSIQVSVTEPADASLCFSVDGERGFENTLVIENLRYRTLPLDQIRKMELQPETKLRLFARQSRLLYTERRSMPKLSVELPDGSKNTLVYLTNDSVRYTDRHDFCMNLGYHADAIDRATMRFSKPGVYTFDAIRFCGRRMSGFKKRLEQLKAHSMTYVTMKDDSVSGLINCPEDGYLFLSIPYAEGWEAFLNGERADILRADIAYMAIPVRAGKTVVQLQYENPYIRIGLFITAFGFVQFVVVILYNEWSRKVLRAEVDAAEEEADIEYEDELSEE